jgi:hypothetical protein
MSSSNILNNKALKNKILERCIATTRGGLEAKPYKEHYNPEKTTIQSTYSSRFDLNICYKTAGSSSLSKGHINVISTGSSIHGGQAGPNLSGYISPSSY